LLLVTNTAALAEAAVMAAAEMAIRFFMVVQVPVL
jgi:hypothetical protein